MNVSASSFKAMYTHVAQLLYWKFSLLKGPSTPFQVNENERKISSFLAKSTPVRHTDYHREEAGFTTATDFLIG